MRHDKRLIKQPAIEHRVHRGVGSSDLDRAEQLVPVRQHFFKRVVDVSRIDETLRPADCGFFLRLCFTQQKDDFARFMRREFDGGLHRRAGIESGAIAAGQIRPVATPPDASSVPLRPMNSLRSQVALETLSLVAAKATRSANSLLKGLRAKIVARWLHRFP